MCQGVHLWQSFWSWKLLPGLVGVFLINLGFIGGFIFCFFIGYKLWTILAMFLLTVTLKLACKVV